VCPRTASQASSGAIRKPVPISRYIVFFSIVAIGCSVDLATKSWMFSPENLGMPHERPVRWAWPNVLGFETMLNEGALFGMGQGKVMVFITLSIIAAIGILCWLFYAGAARDWLLTAALGCITAGIFGNLYDRFGLHGLKWEFGHPAHTPGDPVYAVRDWIKLMIGKFPWPNFNIADALLVCGAVLLIWHAFRANPQAQEQPAKEAN